MSEANLEYIKKIAPFKDLSEESYEGIIPALEEVNYPAGEQILQVGDQGDALYIIREGRVQVFINSPQKGDKIILSTLSSGDYFGEMSLLTGEPRSATVESMDDVRLLRLSKEGFDQIITENPSITVFFSTMLSQRLQDANIQRVETESFYHSKMSPSGDLSEFPVIDVLKFCEHNSLSGKLKLESDKIKAELSFLKGQLQQIQLDDLNEAEAMDKIILWEKGKFVIEPKIFTIEEKNLPKKKVEIEPGNVPMLLESFLNQFFNKMISIIGSRALNEIVSETQPKLIPYFPSAKNFRLQVLPEVKIELQFDKQWGDKQSLCIAVFLQNIYRQCKPLVIGMSFLNFETLAEEYYNQLNDISFFDYLEHANEIAV